MKKITLITLFAMLTLLGKATIYVVPGGAGNGSSWENAYGSIQTAIDAASALYTSTSTPQEVWVKTGTYSTSTAALLMKENVGLFGGFSGTETDKNQRIKGTNAWDYSNATTLDGGAAKRCIEVAANFTNLTTIDGFTITNGNGVGAQLSNNGGGVLLRANLKLQNCIVTGNTATGNGGGVNAAAGIISNCWIYNNTTTSATIPAAGGVYSAPASGLITMIENSLIERNAQGGVRLQSAGAITMDKCIVRNNTSTGNGGAIYLNNPTNCVISNCLITNNSGSSSVYLNKGKLINSTVANNEGNIYLASATNISELYNNIIVNNVVKATTTPTSIGVATGYPTGKVKNNATWPSVAYQTWGDATDSILTVDAENALTQVGFKSPTSFRGRVLSNVDSLNMISAADWSLASGTICINRGDNTLIPAGITTDITGAARTNYTTVDLGAYEYVKTTPTISWTQDLSGVTTVQSPVTLTANLGEGVNGGSITYASSNPSVATVSGNTLTLVGIGSSTITASQAANDYFNVATNVEKNLTVSVGTPTISWTQDLTNLKSDDTSVSLTASSNAGSNGSTITYTSDNESVVTVSGSTLNVVGAGLAVVTAHQAANSWNNAAADVTKNIKVSSVAVTISDGKNITDFTVGSATDVTVNAGGNLAINNTSSLKSLVVAAGGKVTNSSTLNLTTLTINSNTSAAGTYVENGTTTATNASVNQTLTSGRNWYISSPVSGVTTSAINTITGSSILSYDEVHGTSAPWVTESTTLSAGKGYIVVSPTNENPVINFSGTLNTGEITIPLTRTAGQTKEGFNLIGNPYPSYVNWQSATKTNVGSTIWYRTKNTSSTFVFDTYNASTNAGTNNNLSGAVSGLIPPMQAVWVRVDQGQTTGSVVFNNNMRSHATGATTPLKVKSATVSASKLLRFSISNGTNSDEAIIVIHPDASNDFDHFDSEKMTNNNVNIPEIYTLAGSEKVVINGLNSIPANDELSLGFTTGQSNTFNFQATELANMEDMKIFIRDNLLNTTFELTNKDVYTFTSDATSSTDRFALVFKSASITTDIHQAGLKDVKISGKDGKINISGNMHFSANDWVSIYNNVGQLMLHMPLLSSNQTFSNNMAPGVYLVTLHINGEKRTDKIILQ